MRIGLIGYEANVAARVGSNQYAYELIKALHCVDKKNRYLVYLPSSPRSDMPRERSGWHYRVIGPSRFWNLFGLPLALYKDRRRLDLVFNPGHYSPLFSFKPLAVSVMDLGYLYYPEQFTKPIYLKLRFWTGFSVRKATHVFAISDSTRKDLLKHYLINPKKVTVTHLGYDQERFHQKIGRNQVDKVKKRYKITGDYLLFLSTLKPSKNIEGLLQAFKFLTGSDPVNSSKNRDLSLVVAGRKGWLYRKIFQNVKSLGLENQVNFLGYVPDKDIPALMKGAGVYVLPSFWEGFGIPVLEAMACGTPVVASRVGGLPEVVGKAGLLVDPLNSQDLAQKLARVLYNRETAGKLRAEGLKQVKKFTWEKCARKTLSVLENCFAPGA